MSITRRHLLIGAAGAASLSMMPRFAFAQSEDLRLFFWGSQPRADRTYAVTSLFEEAHAGTSIEGEFLGWADYWPKLATVTAGGNASDVVQMDYRYIVEYANRNALAPLDDFVGTQLDLSDFDQDQVEAGKVNGKLYGISLGTNSGATLFNTTALAEAGIELDLMATDYGQLLDAGKKFSDANIRNGMKLLADGSGVELLFENWLRQNGKALYTAEGQPGFGPEDLASWFELWVELREAGACVNADTQSADTGPIETTVITQGKAATQFVTSNQLVAFQALNQDKIGIGIYPKARPDATGGHYRKPSMYFSLSGASSKPELAVEMINFFVNDPEAGKALGVERGVPAASKVRDAIRPELDENSLAAMDFVTNLGDMIGPLPPAPPPAAGEIEVQLRTKSQEVAFGVQSPIDAGNAFFDEVNAILQRSA